ncbi:MAG: DUF2007 domain-containing protein [Bacteroidota bacterium]
MSLITFKTFDSSIDAHFLRIRLENEGIRVYIFDENTAILNPLNMLAIGGIKVKINEEDLETVLKIEKEFATVGIEKDNKQLICDSCNSTEFYTNFKKYNSLKGMIAAFFTLMFTVYPISYKEVYKCKNCGKEYPI